MQNEIVKKNSLNQVASEKFGRYHKIMNNSSGNYALCIEVAGEKQEAPVTLVSRFFVFNLETNNVIFEDKITDGTVRWINDEEISGFRTAGMVKKDSASPSSHRIFTYNVKTNKKKFN